MIDQKEFQFQNYLKEETRKGTMNLIVIGVILFPLFSLLDFLTQHHSLDILTLIRYSAVAYFLGVWFLLRRGLFQKNPFAVATSLLVVGAMVISCMCIVLDGSGSVYYGGVNLVIVGGVLLLPASGKKTALWITLVMMTYVLGILISEKFQVKHPEVFFNNLCFLLSTGVIGMVSGFVGERLRRESFNRFLEIKTTMNLLSEEVQSRHVNMETLAQEIVQKKIEAQSALELRNNFISIASHELKTPLTALKLQADVGKSKFRDGILDWNPFIGSIDNQIKRISRIVDEMLDVSRIQSGKFSFHKETVDLGQLVESIMVGYYAQAFETRSITLDIEDGVRGHWDSFKIEQVILNLLSNAQRYGEGKPVHVMVKKSEVGAQLVVKDQGLGIDHLDQTKIFEKFERGVTSRNFGGLGLGLYICREIIEGHGGRISVESAPGDGSTFFVQLPQA